MLDGNDLRAEFARYLTEHTHTRWGLDAALMHVCRIAYDQGMKDGPCDRRGLIKAPGAGAHNRCTNDKRHHVGAVCLMCCGLSGYRSKIFCTRITKPAASSDSSILYALPSASRASRIMTSLSSNRSASSRRCGFSAYCAVSISSRSVIKWLMYIIGKPFRYLKYTNKLHRKNDKPLSILHQCHLDRDPRILRRDDSE